MSDANSPAPVHPASAGPPRGAVNPAPNPARAGAVLDDAGLDGGRAGRSRLGTWQEGPTARGRTVVPVVVQVAVCLTALVAVLTALVAAPGTNVSRDPVATVGEQEPVRLTGPNGTTLELEARIDTGAASSSLDRDVAERLGLDLENADTIRVGSALGTEERPVVDVALQVAGKASVSRMSVTDRSERSNLVLVGRKDLRGFDVSVGQRQLTTPGAAAAPSAFDVLRYQAPVFGPLALLALLPLASLIIVLLRVVVGMRTLGTFSPVLLAFGYTQAGLPLGLLLTASMFVMGVAAQRVLQRWHLPRVARLAILISLVSAALVAVQGLPAVRGDADSWGAAMPVVVTAVVTERLWEAWDADGLRAAAADAGLTLLVATLMTVVLVAPWVRALAENAPLALALACAMWIFAAGSYKGLRLVELRRFRAVADRPAAEVAA